MKFFPIYAAAILAATIAAQAHAQEVDPLEAATRAAATPAPTPAGAGTPKPAQVQQPRAATTTAAPRSTPAAAKPHEEAKPDLSRAKFVEQNDLAGLAGQKLSNTYLTGIYKATGNKPGGRYEFTTRNVVLGTVIRGSTRIMVRFPKSPDPQTLDAAHSSQWTKTMPLRVERVEKTDDGITVYATDVP